MNQFFYTRKEPRMPQPGDTGVVYNTFTDSFNLNSVVRSYEYEAGKILVMLNDGHEESREVEGAPVKKGGSPERRRVWVVSEIYLEGDDVTRFRAAAGIKEYALTLDKPILQDMTRIVGTPNAQIATQ